MTVWRVLILAFFSPGNQKKAQESHDENVKMVEECLKEKEQLEVNYETYKKDAENEMEKLMAKNAANR